MIITRAPYRVSFFGGGTDYPGWYRQEGGAVLSTTIDKYCYITVRDLPKFFEYNFKLRYFQTEEVKEIDEIVHPSIRETAKYLNVNKPFELVHFAEMPAQSGLGSSSTFTVGLLNALHAFKGTMVSPNDLMAEAIHIEQKMKQIIIHGTRQLMCQLVKFQIGQLLSKSFKVIARVGILMSIGKILTVMVFISKMSI